MTFKMNVLRNFYLCCVILILIVCLGEINCLSCTKPNIANLRYRQRGLRIRFQCSLGYELIGSKSSTCLLGRWRPPVPQCVRAGCPELPSLENGIKVDVRYQALVMFFCNPGFTMEGGSMLSCDGVKWNGTTPVCKSNVTESVPTSCDFEESDCGWENIVGRSFEWQRVSQSTKDEHGPMEDHTNQTDSSHFMEIVHHVSGVFSNFLISPVFPSTLTESGCFVFYYFIRDLASNGGLRVYVFPESEKSNEALIDGSEYKKYMKYEISGQRNDVWLRGDFDLEPLNDRFQVLIESYREVFGGSIVYHAVDDMTFMKKDECEKLRVEKNQTNLKFSPASCRYRCDHDPYEHFKEFNEEVCFCDEAYCMSEKYSCCSDYNDFCVFGSSTNTNDDSPTTDNSYTESEFKQTTSSTSDTSVVATKQNTLNSTVYKTTVSNFKDITTASKYPLKPITYPPTVQKLTTTSPKTTQKATPSTTKTTITTAKPTTTEIMTTKSTTLKIVTTKPTPLKIETTDYSRNKMETTKTASRSTIKLLTYMPIPYKNFTGILNKTDDSEFKITNKTYIFRNKGIRVIPLGTPPNNVTKSTIEPTSTIVTTTNVPFLNQTTTLAVPKLSEKIMSFQVAKVAEKTNMPRYAKWLMTLSGVGLILLITGAVLMKTGKIRRINNPLKNKRNRHLSRPGSSADMRYLVEDEELEHDY